MSEKKTISGVRTDLSPSEFGARMSKANPKGAKKSGNIKRGFGKVNYILSALGLMPMLTSDSGSKGHRSHGHVAHTPNSFKESYRVEQTPRARTHEDWVKEEIAQEAYMKMVDGKGDHDCGHEH